MAIKLDKLVLVIPSYCIECWMYDRYSYRGEGLPYKLAATYNPHVGNCRLEFSAKILGDRYPELINVNNIDFCLSAVNNVGFCRVNVDRTIREARVIGADFTKDVRLADISCVNDLNDLKKVVHLSINNYRRWCCRDYRGSGGMVISNTVSDIRYLRRVTIYDKTHELTLNRNREFINSLRNTEGMYDYFRGRVRFELRATRQYQLRQWLNIVDLSLRNVLTSDANPLECVMSEIFSPINAVGINVGSALTSQNRIALLKSLDWDLARVEEVVRVHSTNPTRDMKPYRALYQIHNNFHRDINIVDAVR